MFLFIFFNLIFQISSPILILVIIIGGILWLFHNFYDLNLLKKFFNHEIHHNDCSDIYCSHIITILLFQCTMLLSTTIMATYHNVYWFIHLNRNFIMILKFSKKKKIKILNIVVMVIEKQKNQSINMNDLKNVKLIIVKIQVVSIKVIKINVFKDKVIVYIFYCSVLVSYLY